MKGKNMGYDPDLGRKFAEESNGFVIGRGKSSPTVSDEELEDQEMAFQAQVEQDWIEEHGRAPDTPVAVVSDGATPSQRVLRTTLTGLATALREEQVRPPAVWVVGDVVALGA